MVRRVAVYFKPRVLIVLLLGFSAGLRFAHRADAAGLDRRNRMDIRTIGPVRGCSNAPLAAKPLSAPASTRSTCPYSRACSAPAGLAHADANPADRRGSLLLAINDRPPSPSTVAGAASAGHDRLSRRTSLIERSASKACPERNRLRHHVVRRRLPYRVLISAPARCSWSAGLIGTLGLDKQAAARLSSHVALVLVGHHRNLARRNPGRVGSRTARTSARARKSSWKRVTDTAIASFSDSCHATWPSWCSPSASYFQFADTLASALNDAVQCSNRLHACRAPHHHQGRRFCRGDCGRFCLASSRARFADGDQSLNGGVLQAVATFRLRVASGRRPDVTWLTLPLSPKISPRIGTVIFWRLCSALLRNPLHTATRYALLTALVRASHAPTGASVPTTSRRTAGT